MTIPIIRSHFKTLLGRVCAFCCVSMMSSWYTKILSWTNASRRLDLRVLRKKPGASWECDGHWENDWREAQWTKARAQPAARITTSRNPGHPFATRPHGWVEKSDLPLNWLLCVNLLKCIEFSVVYTEVNCTGGHPTTKSTLRQGILVIWFLQWLDESRQLI